MRTLWGLLAFLSLVGIVGAAMRAYVVATTVRMPVAARPNLAPIDQRNLAIVKAARHVTPGSREDATLERDMAHLATRYVSHPVYSFLHLAPGVLILLLAPFQFSRHIRSRHLRVHRWSGRTILLAGIATAISAVYFGIVNPLVPRMEPITIGIMTAVFVFAGTRGYFAIRAREIERHREWMTRMYAIAVGIGMVRLVAFPITFGFPRMDPGLLLMVTFWVGWLVMVVGAELWIRRTRVSRAIATAMLVSCATSRGVQTPPVIAIDPGHPSETSSGAEIQNGTSEVHVAWQVALKLEQELRTRGYSVVMTKSSETQMVRNVERANVGNRARAALMVRLHCDASSDSGFALYYPDRQGTAEGKTGPNLDVIRLSAAAAESLHAGMAPLLAGQLKDGGVRGDSRTLVGSRQGALTGSIFSEIPVVLIEMVTLSNTRDAEFIKGETGQGLMARAIADGVARSVPRPRN